MPQFRSATAINSVGMWAVLLLLAAAASSPAAASELSITFTDQNGRALPDVVIVAHADGVTDPQDGAAAEVTIDQVGKAFVPVVTVVRVGTRALFPNHDQIRHHVYSLSPAKQFELPLYAGLPPQPVVFDRPGIVTLGCNIHDWMVAYVYVTDSPHFAKSDDHGVAQLNDLAPGTYRLTTWHPGLRAAADERKVVLGPDGQLQQAVRLQISNDWAPQRAPATSSGIYR